MNMHASLEHCVQFIVVLIFRLKIIHSLSIHCYYNKLSTKTQKIKASEHFLKRDLRLVNYVLTVVTITLTIIIW